MSFTPSDLAAIERAIASGESTVSFNGRTVTYRSMADLLRAREVIRQAVNAQNARRGGLDGSSFSVARFD